MEKDHMDRFMIGFVFVWSVLLLMLNACVVATSFFLAPTILAGWLRVTKIYSPYTPSTIFINLALASPAIGALAWLKRREARRNRGQ